MTAELVEDLDELIKKYNQYIEGREYIVYMHDGEYKLTTCKNIDYKFKSKKQRKKFDAIMLDIHNTELESLLLSILEPAIVNQITTYVKESTSFKIGSYTLIFSK